MLIIDYAERAHRHFWEIFILIIFCLDKKLTDYICFGLNHDKIRVSSKKGYAAVYVIIYQESITFRAVKKADLSVT